MADEDGRVSARAKAEFLDGIKAELPICLGVIPFGMIFGVVAVGAGLDVRMALGMSMVVLAGSAQFIAVQLVEAKAAAIVILSTTLVVNLRHLLYSFSMAPYLRDLRLATKGLLGYLLTDEAYAVSILRYRRSHEETPRAQPPHAYYWGASLTLWVTWQLSTAAGALLGAQVPASWSLEFALPLTFIALMVPTLRDRASVVAAATGGLVAVLAAGASYRLGLMAGALLGIGAGLAFELLRQRVGRTPVQREDRR
jgi:4-azaleucine resistance transporter AzlC